LGGTPVSKARQGAPAGTTPKTVRSRGGA
jgi:hypothetical protein